MIIYNISFSIILLLGSLFYSYIYPRKKINLFILLIVISLLPIISIFRTGDYESGDFNIHVYRAMDFYNSLSQGNLIPSWAGNLNSTYGYPLFIFLNPLPYYFQSLIHFLGFSFIGSLKILLALSFLLSGIFFFFWAKRESKRNFSAFLATVVYLFSPYHLVDLHFRASIGEVMVFMTLPMTFYSISRFKEARNTRWYLISALSLALMILCHQAMALFSLVLIFPYFFYDISKKELVKNSIVYLSIIFIGFIGSIYTWLPHVIYPKFTLAHILSDHAVSFPKLQDLLYSPWRYGFLFQGHKGELSYVIGYSQIIILILGLLLIIKKKTKELILKPLVLWIGISFFLIFMITPFSSILWKLIPILNTAQFSTRLLLLLSFSIATSSMYLSNIFKEYRIFLWIFLIITISYTFLNWGHRRVIPEINDSTLSLNLPKSTQQGEGFCCMAQPKWTDGNWPILVPKNHIEIIKNQGEIKEISRTSDRHQYISFSLEKLTVKENTWFFPGWKLLIDGKTSEINYTDPKYPGIVLFTIPPGLHEIILIYSDPFELFFAKLISLITLSTLIFSISLLYLRKYLSAILK